MTKNVELPDVSRLVAEMIGRSKTREDVARWALEIVQGVDAEAVVVADDAWELVLYLMEIDVTTPDDGYLFDDEQVRAECMRLGALF